MYHNCKVNYDIQNSNFISTFTEATAKSYLNDRPIQVVPTDSSNTTKVIFNQMNDDHENEFYFTYFNSEDMEETESRHHKNEYYISNFLGHFDNNTYYFDIYYNDSMTYSIPATINSISNVILSQHGIDETITVNSQPFSYVNTLNYFINHIAMSILLCLCISLVISFFGPSIIEEKSKKLIKQLNLCGITNKIYWISNFVLHYSLMLFLVFAIIILYAIFGLELYRNVSNVLMIMVFVALTLVPSMFFQYFLTLFFKKEGIAILVYMIINFIPPIIFMIYNFAGDVGKSMGIERDSFTNLKEVSRNLVSYTLFPILMISKGIQQLITFNIQDSEGEPSHSIEIKAFFDYKRGVLLMLIGCVLSTLFYIGIVLYYLIDVRNREQITIKDPSLYEEWLRMNYKKLMNGNQDVIEEYKRVHAFEHHQNSPLSTAMKKSKTSVVSDTADADLPIRITTMGKEFFVYNKVKTYDEFIKGMKNKNPKYGEYHLSDFGCGKLVVTTLNNINLGINANECFGLIGPNGAGKSTLLDIISYTTEPTCGHIYYDGVDRKDIKNDHFRMGYCSQMDTLWNKMTLYEHLIAFLYLRGYSMKECKSFTNYYMKYCKIEEHKQKYPEELSGGTRRKLCILLALCSFTNKIVLDEPSTGMDPATRRYMWDIIQDYKENEQSSVILTTHCMEEAELLCDRIALLVNGELQAVGSVHHLKLNYNNTYTLEIECPNVKTLDYLLKTDLPFLTNRKVNLF